MIQVVMPKTIEEGLVIHRELPTLKEQGAVDTKHSGRRTIVIPLRPSHGATRAFFNGIEAAMRRGGNPRHRSKTDIAPEG